MDIVAEVQNKLGCVCDDAMDEIAKCLSIPRVDVESIVSFYSFFSREKKGKFTIRLCNDIVDMLQGAGEVAVALEEELGVRFGETTSDGLFTLEWTPCIGMSDQAPAALVNEVVLTRLSPDKAREAVRSLRKHSDPLRLVREFGDGNNAHDLVRSMVVNHVRETGPVIFGSFDEGSAIQNAIEMTPQEVIRAIKTARLRGRGGAGFPTGMKWEFTRAADEENKIVICNADEGEPGTFKDRVILTERPGLLFEGMTIAGYAIGAKAGILYLRGEYAYLRPFLEYKLDERRKNGLLGSNVAGKSGFDFDIRIQMGAGAYVCGEETALISSCEGLRGDPKNRPPFPAQKGYLGLPTSVNNVETFCCAARIIEKGAGWFAKLGNDRSSGTKILSIAGDCSRPGIYELPFGISIRELVQKAGAREPIAVQVGGAAGVMVPPDQFDRQICFDDLATGGSIIIFGQGRDLLGVVEAFLEFFVEESCGYCTPCRVGNVIMRDGIRQVRNGEADASTIGVLESVSRNIKAASRCGLGQTSPNPVLSTIGNFGGLYKKAMAVRDEGPKCAFDLEKSTSLAKSIVDGRQR